MSYGAVDDKMEQESLYPTAAVAASSSFFAGVPPAVAVQIQQPVSPQQFSNYYHVVRKYYGNDTNIDISDSFLPHHEEMKRTENLNVLVNPNNYDSQMYWKGLIGMLKVNNFVYRFVYQGFFMLLAVFFGIVISIGMGLFSAFSEFFNQFILRPFLRITRIYLGAGTILSQMIYEICRPLMALFLPWNKH